jgi:aldehyde dehydrogenase (NAD+)
VANGLQTEGPARWKYDLFVDGEWRPGKSGTTYDLFDPASEALFGSVALGDVADAEAAIAAARHAFDEGPWPQMSLAERSAFVQKALDYITARQSELLEMEVAECGSPVRTAAGLHVGYGLMIGQALIGAAPRLALERPLPFNQMPFSASTVVREPIGVCSAITPFNFPLLLAIYKVFPALLLGNTMVLKPNPATPLSAGMLAEAFAEAALPAGVFNFVTGDADAGTTLASHPAVDKVAFTGSTAVGRTILQSAAGTMKRVTLELGGKSPSLLCDDADLDLAVDGILFGVYLYAGQCCEAGSRVLVPRGMEAEVVERLETRVGQLRLGDTRDEATDVGPVLSHQALERIERKVDDAVAAGAELVCGGRRADLGRGHYYQPTILRNVELRLDIAREEVFGPVLVVLPYGSLDEAVRMANDSDYGLAATIWSRNLPQAYTLARKIRAGTVWINDHHMVRPDAPFGGFGQSGLGREIGEEGFYEYTESKHIHVGLEPNPFWSMLLPSGKG